jgi:hypothetical protein
MLAWWALVWPVVAVPHAAAAWHAHRQHGTRPAHDEATAMRTLLAMAVVFMAILIAPPSYALVSGQVRGEGKSLVSDTPIYLADEIARREFRGNIACPMDWADYLIWKTDGRLKPLVYSHVHLTNIETWRDYESLFRGDPAWLQVLHDHQMQLLAVSRKRHPELAKLVSAEARAQRPRLRIVYQDQRCLLAELTHTVSQPATSNSGKPSATSAATFGG